MPQTRSQLLVLLTVLFFLDTSYLLAESGNGTPEPDSLLKRAWQAENERRFGDAANLFRRALAENPKEPRAAFGLAVSDAFIAAQDADSAAGKAGLNEAERLLEGLSQFSPAVAPVFRWLALVDCLRIAAELKTARASAGIDPHKAIFINDSAVRQRFTTRCRPLWESGAENIVKALQLNPIDTESFSVIFLLLSEGAQFAASADEFERELQVAQEWQQLAQGLNTGIGSSTGGSLAVKPSPLASTHAEASELDERLVLSWKLLDTGDKLDQCIFKLNGLIRLQPNLAAAYYLRGRALLQSRRYLAAIEDFTTAMRLKAEPKTEVLRDRATAYFSIGRQQDAMNDLTNLIKLQPTDGGAPYQRSFSDLALKQYDRAFADLKQAIQLRPSYGMYEFRAAIRIRLGDAAGAHSDYAEFRRLWNLAVAYSGLQALPVSSSP